MRAEIVSVVAVLATVVSVVLVLPQVWRTCLEGRTGGVAPGHVWGAVLTSATWVHFGLQSGATGAAVNSALGGVLHGLVLLGLFRAVPDAVGRQAALAVPAGVAWLLAHAALADAGALGLVGALTAAASVLAALPQVVVMLRRPDLDWSGVSATSWRLSAAASGCWLAYWALRGDLLLVVPSLVGLVAAGIVLGLLRDARARAAVRPVEAMGLAA